MESTGPFVSHNFIVLSAHEALPLLFVVVISSHPRNANASRKLVGADSLNSSEVLVGTQCPGKEGFLATLNRANSFLFHLAIKTCSPNLACSAVGIELVSVVLQKVGKEESASELFLYIAPQYLRTATNWRS